MDGEARRLLVRECGPPDVARLEEHHPTGRNRYHEARYRRQSAGRSTFLIAHLGEIPVGWGEVLWQGAKEPDVRDRFPGCPEINGLAVIPRWRSRGVGTLVIRTAEQLSAERGHDRIGLGVAEDNSRAAALYHRLGYRDTGCRYLDRYRFVDDDGLRHEIGDRCRFLVKVLSDH